MTLLSGKLVYGFGSWLNSSVEANFINLPGQCKNKKTKELLCVYIANKNLFIYSYKICTQNISIITTSHSPKQLQIDQQVTGKAFAYLHWSIYKFTKNVLITNTIRQYFQCLLIQDQKHSNISLKVTFGSVSSSLNISFLILNIHWPK